MPTQNLTAGSPCLRSPRKRYSGSSGDGNSSTSGIWDTFLDNFGAELTEAAYPVMLRHGAVDNWLDLELELWRVLREIVKKWDQEWPSAGVMLVSSCNTKDGSALDS